MVVSIIQVPSDGCIFAVRTTAEATLSLGYPGAVRWQHLYATRTVWDMKALEERPLGRPYPRIG